MLDYRITGVYIEYIYIYIPGTHLSVVLPPKGGLFQSKQRTFGFHVYVCLLICIIYIDTIRYTLHTFINIYI